MDRRKQIIFAFCLALLSLSAIKASAVTVGVRKGDWIEYEVTFTGTPSAGHDVIWARMEILDVQGPNITLITTTRDSSGTQENSTTNLNLEQGKLGDRFIIPANLSSGDMFFDENTGNVTISGSEQRVVAEAERTVVYAESPQGTVYWDKATGVVVEGHSSNAEFTMTTKADRTNMWEPQGIKLDQTFVIAFLIALFSAAAVAVAFVLVRKSKKKPLQRKANDEKPQ